MQFKGKTRFAFESFKILIIIGLFIFSDSDAFCQEKEFKSEYDKEFEAFKKTIQEEFIEFKSKNDSIFSEFLKNSWKEYELSVEERVIRPKPKVQPVHKNEKSEPKEIIPLRWKTIMEDTAKQLQLNISPKIYNTINEVLDDQLYRLLDFYGTPIQMPIPQDSLPKLTQVSNEGIGAFFTEASENKDLYSIISKSYNESLQKELNGWGLLQLLQSVSDSIYGSINDRVLFTWFSLLKCQQNAKVAYDSNNNIYLLSTFDVPVYYRPYITSGTQRYYLIEFEGQKITNQRLYSYDTIHPGAKEPLALHFKCLPKLASKAVTKEYTFRNNTINISYDTNIVNYYNNYPDCDIAVNFQPPLSDEAIKSIDNIIEPNIENQKIIDRVNFLLEFVQYAILYDTDDNQFGYENYLFAEELLSSSAADCEDRSIFLSHLIDHYLGLRVIGLEYPGHFTLAVNMPGKIDGYYVLIDEDRYYVCDPTYIGSKLGMLMPQFKNVQPEIIKID